MQGRRSCRPPASGDCPSCHRINSWPHQTTRQTTDGHSMLRERTEPDRCREPDSGTHQTCSAVVAQTQPEASGLRNNKERQGKRRFFHPRFPPHSNEFTYTAVVDFIRTRMVFLESCTGDPFPQATSLPSNPKWVRLACCHPGSCMPLLIRCHYNELSHCAPLHTVRIVPGCVDQAIQSRCRYFEE